MAKQIIANYNGKEWGVMVPDRALANPEGYANYLRIYVNGKAGRIVMKRWLESKRIAETDLYHHDGRPIPELIPSVSQQLRNEFDAEIESVASNISVPTYGETMSTH